MSSAKDQQNEVATTHLGVVRRQEDLASLVELTRALANRDDIFEILFSVVSRLADVLGVDRGSIVLRGDDGDQNSQIGIVVATSDDAAMRNHRLPLKKYPEIRQVLETGHPLVIEDVSSSPLLTEVLPAGESFSFSSMALIPIVVDEGPIAALVLKGAAAADWGEYELSHAQAVANATAIALGNARTLRKLRAETQELFSAHAKDAQKLRELSRYLDVFESSRDAMLVLDHTGQIVFANPQAERLTRRPAQDLVGTPLDELFHGSDQKAVRHLIFQFEGNEFPTGLDFVLAPPAPRTIAEVDFSPVLGEGSAVLAALRDVTAERGLARELSQTKEFLERVIDSSVDGIVSADLKGNVLIYNRAAAKLFGYAANEVLGCLTVDKLYPAGVARDIMRRIRRAEHGGEGRLEEYRVEMLTKSGVLVPVNLSASLVLDGKRPIGTVGIFTDIRDRLAMEERLLQAQAQLEERRRTDAIAEVAGAAAHELNQPLTSVMGYAEYLKRRVEEDPALVNAVEVILSETQRMADIVRKVGRITRYETKPYVGGAKIVDIDASSNPEG